MTISYGRVLSNSRRKERLKAKISRTYENFSQGRSTKENTLRELYVLGVSREEAEEKLSDIQKAIDSIN